MRNNPLFKLCVLMLIFMVAFVLEIMPWPAGFPRAAASVDCAGVDLLGAGVAR